LVQGNGELASVEVKDGVVLTEGVEESRRKVVGVVENVEELRAKLGVKSFGDFGDREVFKNGEVNSGKTWSIEFVASGVAEDV